VEVDRDHRPVEGRSPFTHGRLKLRRRVWSARRSQVVDRGESLVPIGHLEASLLKSDEPSGAGRAFFLAGWQEQLAPLRGTRHGVAYDHRRGVPAFQIEAVTADVPNR
jgi:hypothetical protein